MAHTPTLLQKARARRGWTLEELAERAGLSKTAVNDAERAVRQPQLRTVGRLCDVLDLEFDDVWADIQARLPEDARRSRRGRRRRTDRVIPIPEPEKQAS